MQYDSSLYSKKKNGLLHLPRSVTPAKEMANKTFKFPLLVNRINEHSDLTFISCGPQLNSVENMQRKNTLLFSAESDISFQRLKVESGRP